MSPSPRVYPFSTFLFFFSSQRAFFSLLIVLVALVNVLELICFLPGFFRQVLKNPEILLLCCSFRSLFTLFLSFDRVCNSHFSLFGQFLTQKPSYCLTHLFYLLSLTLFYLSYSSFYSLSSIFTLFYLLTLLSTLSLFYLP